MTPAEAPRRWVKITGADGKTVYWSRPKSPETGLRLAVSAHPKWTWKVFGPPDPDPPTRGAGRAVVVAQGHCASVVGGRILAERAERELTVKP